MKYIYVTLAKLYRGFGVLGFGGFGDRFVSFQRLLPNTLLILMLNALKRLISPPCVFSYQPPTVTQPPPGPLRCSND